MSINQGGYNVGLFYFSFKILCNSAIVAQQLNSQAKLIETRGWPVDVLAQGIDNL